MGIDAVEKFVDLLLLLMIVVLLFTIQWRELYFYLHAYICTYFPVHLHVVTDFIVEYIVLPTTTTTDEPPTTTTELTTTEYTTVTTSTNQQTKTGDIRMTTYYDNGSSILDSNFPTEALSMVYEAEPGNELLTLCKSR